MGRLEGKVAIITGAARGQGASHARRFVAEGARVVIGDVGEEDGTALAAELGPSARFVRLDVADEGSWRAALELTHAELGPPTVLVNNADDAARRPRRRLAVRRPADLARRQARGGDELVVYLASDEASYSTGGDFVVDGGVTAGGLPPSARGS